MDATLQKQFERIEAALNTLVDSITTYNPSPQAAIELLAADDELSSGLSQRAHRLYPRRKLYATC